MTNQSDEIEALKVEVEELNFRLYKIESFLSSFEGESSEPSNLDDSFNEVAEFLKDQEYIMAATLERRLDIGYTRACRIIDQMQSMDMVSPPGSILSNRRKVNQAKIKEYLEGIK